MPKQEMGVIMFWCGRMRKWLHPDEWVNTRTRGELVDPNARDTEPREKFDAAKWRKRALAEAKLRELQERAGRAG